MSFADWEQQAFCEDRASDWSDQGECLEVDTRGPRGKFSLGESPAPRADVRDAGTWAGTDPIWGFQARVSPWLRDWVGLSVHTEDKKEQMMRGQEAFETTTSR